MKRLLITTALVMASLSAQCDIYSFYGITTNDPSGTASAIGEAQFSMDVTVIDSTTVSFSIANSGPDYNSIAKICFESSSSLGLISTSPMSWSEENSGQLPGANGWFTSDFCLIPDPPPSMNGITPLTSPLEVILSYDAGFDILGALNTADFRVGLHATGIGDDGMGDDYSESFINNIPEPSTALLLGFVALVGRSYRKIFVV